MSFAIIQTGGKQYKVKAGEIVKIEKFGDQKPNSIIEFKKYLPMEMIKILRWVYLLFKEQK